MTHDIKYENGDVVRTDDGDLDTVSDVDLVTQTLRLVVSDEVETLIGEPLSSEQINELETRIAAGIERRSHVTLTGVEITEVNRQTNTLTATVRTRHHTIPITTNI